MTVDLLISELLKKVEEWSKDKKEEKETRKNFHSYPVFKEKLDIERYCRFCITFPFPISFSANSAKKFSKDEINEVIMRLHCVDKPFGNGESDKVNLRQFFWGLLEIQLNPMVRDENYTSPIQQPL